MRKFIVKEGPKVLLDTIAYHLKKRTDFAGKLSNRLYLRSLKGKILKLGRRLTDGDAYMLGYMLMVYSQDTNNQRIQNSYEYVNEHVLKKLDDIFKGEE